MIDRVDAYCSAAGVDQARLERRQEEERIERRREEEKSFEVRDKVEISGSPETHEVVQEEFDLNEISRSDKVLAGREWYRFGMPRAYSSLEM